MKKDAMLALHDKVIELLSDEKRGKVLDVPANEGVLAHRIQKLGFDVWCGDIDPSRFKATTLSCDYADLNKRWPYEDGFFDIVICTEGIEHLENPWHVIREINRVLKIDGALFLSTPNVLSLKSRLSYLLYGYPNYFHYMIEIDPNTAKELAIDHINPVGFLELRHILCRSGFRVEFIETNHYQKHWSLFYRLLKLVIATRGRSAIKEVTKADVRKTLLSDILMFGENLIVKAKKICNSVEKCLQMSKVSGVIWIGRFFEHGGWGTIARNYVRGLRKIGFPVKAIPVGSIHPDLEYQLRSEFAALLKTDVGKYPVVVIDKGTGFFKQVLTRNVVRRIGCALAEMDRVPSPVVVDCNDIDELWVPSHFSKETFSRSGVPADKIRVIPYAVDTNDFVPRPAWNRIPGSRSFTFLFVFGAGLRKGYDLLLEAYFNEFKSSDDVTLVLKVFSGDFRGIHVVDVRSKIMDSVADRVDLTRTDLPHVVFIDEIFSHDQLLDLYSGCDLYISTARAEGWGFPCMEAMAMGKPAATINWSGSTEFMHKDNSLLIQPTGRLVPVDPKLEAENPFYTGNLWAEVRVEEVQRVMRYAYGHPEELKQISERGKRDIRQNYSVEAVARKVVAAVSEIPVVSRRHMGRPKIRFKKAYGLKFRARLLYYRFRHWYTSLRRGMEAKKYPTR